MKEGPKPEDILARLEPVTVSLKAALRKAITRARRFLNDRREFDPIYFAARIRLEARRFLALDSLEMSEESDEASTLGTELMPIPNIGLQFFRDGVLAKLLKRSDDVEMPLPVPASNKRVGFYNQQEQMVAVKSGAVHKSQWNTTYLWRYNDKL